MAHVQTKNLSKSATELATQSLKEQGFDAKEVKLRTESMKERARRKRIKKILREKGLGNPSRDKLRFVREE